MMHLLGLGFKVEFVVLVGFHLDRHGFHNFKSIALDSSHLARIVGYETHFGNANMS